MQNLSYQSSSIFYSTADVEEEIACRGGLKKRMRRMRGGDLRRERYRGVSGKKRKSVSTGECVWQQVTVGNLHLWASF